MNAHVFQAVMLADSRRRADYLRVASLAMPDAAIDVQIWRRVLQAGVEPAEYAPILAGRASRAADWDWHESLAVARESLVSVSPVRPAPPQNTSCTGICGGRPRRYIWCVAGAEMTIPSAAMTSPRKFKDACLAQISVLPVLPSTKEWDGWIAAQIATAPLIADAEESSEEGAQKENIEEALRNLMQGETYDDLMAGKWLEKNCRKVIRLQPLLRQARMLDQTLRSVDVARSLRELDWLNSLERIGAGVVRVWASPDIIAKQATASERLTRASVTRKLGLVSGNSDKPFFDDDDIGSLHD